MLGPKGALAATQIQTRTTTLTQSNHPTLHVNRQQLATLPQVQRLAVYEQTLLRSTAIRISPDGSPPVGASHLTIPTHVNDAVATEAAIVFYSGNRFEMPIETLPSFATRQISNSLRSSDLVTQLTVLYGKPQYSGVGEKSDYSELLPALSMPRLRRVCLVFPESALDKTWGFNDYLLPSAWAILELQKKTELMLQKYRRVDDVVLDITNATSYLDPPTPADEAAWLEGER